MARKTIPDLVHESQAWAKGYRLVAGVDEVGRGPLAGPVVAAAVLLTPDCVPPWAPLVRDSKALSARRREALAAAIAEQSPSAIAVVSAAEVDAVGIVGAAQRAMAEAIAALRPAPEFAIIDGVAVPQLDLPAVSVVRGDARCVSVAAASIVAKVARDRIMADLDGRYPGYGFAVHKGYGTPEHLRTLAERGPCPVHRHYYLPVLETSQGTAGPRDADPRRRLGALGERLAAAHLESLGYTIVERNLRSRWGELDIVARHGAATVFVEVRTRRGSSVGRAEESIRPTKARRLVELAAAYAQAHPDCDGDLRIDVVAIELPPHGASPRIAVIENAVEEAPLALGGPRPFVASP